MKSPIVIALVAPGVLLVALLVGISKRPPKSITHRDVRPRGADSLMPSGKFKNIHSVRVSEGDGTTHDVQQRLEADTCFTPGAMDADATLRVEIVSTFTPPEGMAHFRVIDMDIEEVFRAVLVNGKGGVLWRGTGSTHQKMITGPDVVLPAGMAFYKDIPASAVAELLMLKLRDAACVPRTAATAPAAVTTVAAAKR
jgi:hypothetical protein